jgi:hypothetical protein
MFGLWIICVFIAFVLSFLLRSEPNEKDEYQGKTP